MRFAAGTIAVILFACLLPVRAGAPAVYQVEFVVYDSAAKPPQPPRHFTIVIDESRKGVFQAGNRIPASDVHPDSQIDVGARIECAVRGAGDRVELNGSMELSDVAGNVCVGGCEPIIQQRKMVFHKTVVLGTATVLAEAGTLRVEATVGEVP
jgi:hypothetical protein